MCFAASLVGVIVFLRKESLLGESLSHAAYPGVILGAVLTSFGSAEPSELLLTVAIMAGAFCTALLGFWLITRLERSFRVPSDAALCFILSAFFGIGLTLASYFQFSEPSLYKQAQAYLFGQVATMTDWHIIVYGCLALVTTGLIYLFYKELQMFLFDQQLATTLGLPTRFLEAMLFFLITLAVVVGLRSVGVVLISAMLIAPAAAARQFTHRLSFMLSLAGCFGLTSGFLGNYLSVELSHLFSPHGRFALPTGPMIVLVSAFICLGALLFAPERGFFPRLARMMTFYSRCLAENLLKSMWRFGPNTPVSLDQLSLYQRASRLRLRLMLAYLRRSGWIERTGNNLYRLNKDGQMRAAKIVRLHRLWEVYLVDYLGVGAERVHRNAEEMEHIITPELERELTLLLNNPKRDPHLQPIPR